MKLKKIATTLLGSALLLSAAAIAGETNKSSINLTEKISVEGKNLDPGRYNVQWTGNGPNVQVTLAQGRQQVATFPARLTEGATKNISNAYGTAASADGSKSLTTIYVGGKTYILELEQNSANRQQDATSAK